MGAPFPRMMFADDMAWEIESGAWLLNDPTSVGTLTLSSIGCELPFDWVFKGMDIESA